MSPFDGAALFRTQLHAMMVWTRQGATFEVNVIDFTLLPSVSAQFFGSGLAPGLVWTDVSCFVNQTGFEQVVFSQTDSLLDEFRIRRFTYVYDANNPPQI